MYKLCELDERESVQWAGQGLYPSVVSATSCFTEGHTPPYLLLKLTDVLTDVITYVLTDV